jgi:hypothetical protein
MPSLKKSNDLSYWKMLVMLLPLLLVTACFTEDPNNLAEPATFVRSYSNGYNMEAIQIIEDNDADGGFTILANTEIRDSEAESFRYKIVIIKTDAFGNEISLQHYPPIADNSRNFVATSLLGLDGGGYLILGFEIEQLNVNNSAEIEKYKPLIIPISNDGTPSSDMTYTVTENAKAMAATPYQSGEFLVLFQSEDPDSSMAVSRVSSTLALVSSGTVKFAGDQTTLSNRLFFNSGTPEFVFFGGTSTRSNKNDGRFVKTKIGSSTTEFDQTLGESTPNESINDICRFGSGFAAIGNSNKNLGNDDILFMSITSSGTVIDNRIFVTEILDNDTYQNTTLRDQFAEADLNTKNETGNSIAPVTDGGLIILATIDSYGDPIPLGAGNSDMLLMKINAFGERIWVQTIGGKDAESGACVRETSDNGFMVLGTTRVGARTIVQFVKTDALGDID